MALNLNAGDEDLHFLPPRLHPLTRPSQRLTHRRFKPHITPHTPRHHDSDDDEEEDGHTTDSTAASFCDSNCPICLVPPQAPHRARSLSSRNSSSSRKRSRSLVKFIKTKTAQFRASHAGHASPANENLGMGAMDDFAGISFANRRPPLIPNTTKELHCNFDDDLLQLKVRGEILCVSSGFQVHLWSAKSPKAAKIFRHGPGGLNTACEISTTGRYIWVGTRKGHLYQIDTTSMKMTAVKKKAHQSTVKWIFRSSNSMYSIDRDGVLLVFDPELEKSLPCSLTGPCKQFTLPDRPVWIERIQGQLWVGYASEPNHHVGLFELQVWEIAQAKNSPTLVFEKGWKIDTTQPHALGIVTCATVVPINPEFVYVGHASGHVSGRVTCICGPSRFLWIGFESGHIAVVDVTTSPQDWRVLKRWLAHKGPVMSMFVDTKSIWTASSLRIVSTGFDSKVKFWDGFLRADWLTSTLSQRESEFCRFSPIGINLFSWNVGAAKPSLLKRAGTTPNNRSLFEDFLGTLRNPDLIVVGLQEVIDLTDWSLAAKIFFFDKISKQYANWETYLKSAVLKYLGPEYVMVQDSKLVGLYQIIFARTSIHQRMKDLATSHVKTGFGDKYGNKGALATRFVLSDSSFCFLNVHLTAGEGKSKPLIRAHNILEILSAKFPFPKNSSTRQAFVARGDGTCVSDHELTWFAGDMNFRIQGKEREEVLGMIEKGEHENLLQDDELNIQMRENKAFGLHGFEEGEIYFDPTYKGTETYDTSAKQRTPAWTDRILFRSESARKIACLEYDRFEADISDHRPVHASFECLERKIDVILRERVWRQVVKDWAAVEQHLLESARTYFESEQ